VDYPQVMKRTSFCVICTKNNPFTKTGSGHT
jgi:hypothetical protein